MSPSDEVQHVPGSVEEAGLDPSPGRLLRSDQFEKPLDDLLRQCLLQMPLFLVRVQPTHIVRGGDDAQDPQRWLDLKRIRVEVGGRDPPQQRHVLTYVGPGLRVKQQLPRQGRQLRGSEPEHHTQRPPESWAAPWLARYVLFTESVNSAQNSRSPTSCKGFSEAGIVRRADTAEAKTVFSSSEILTKIPSTSRSNLPDDSPPTGNGSPPGSTGRDRCGVP